MLPFIYLFFTVAFFFKYHIKIFILITKVLGGCLLSFSSQSKCIIFLLLILVLLGNIV